MLLACFFLSIQCHAQYFNLPNEYAFAAAIEKQLAHTDSSIHSGMQPYIQFFGQKYVMPVDSSAKHRSKYWLSDVLFYRSFVDLNVDSGNFKLRINPIINVEGGRDLADTVSRNLYTNTRGIIGAGSVGKRFYFETLFSENQSVFSNYISNQTKTLEVVPGQGRWKNFKTNGYDYAFSSGFFSFQANKHLNIQAGHGKQKVGYGYRSLLLTDNALTYPYLRVTQQWLKGKLQYTTVYALFSNLVSASKVINPNAERLYQKKAAAFQYLSFNPNKGINVGLFQSLICAPGDSTNTQHLPWQYFNPLLFSNLASYGLDSKNNINIGADLRCKLNSSFNVYAQALLDYVAGSKRSKAAGALQFGFNYFDAFSLKGLRIQAEVNHTFGDVYKTEKGALNYTQYGQTIGFVPMEGTELIANLFYRYKRLFVQGKAQYLQHTASFAAASTITSLSGNAGIVVNAAYNMQLSAGALVRMQNFATFSSANTNYFYLSLRTNIYNFYYDF